MGFIFKDIGTHLCLLGIQDIGRIAENQVERSSIEDGSGIQDIGFHEDRRTEIRTGSAAREGL